ncbi:calpain small subunit 1-like [Amphiura filiformis]|uniref:calpain small subunit 1-like n=1 Tax=Amphiura filiformis TaxID=82378 RepID=UPI003B228D82
MAYDHEASCSKVQLPYTVQPVSIDVRVHAEERKNRLYIAFKRIAGEDNEVDPWELQELLNTVVKRDPELWDNQFSLDACKSMVAMTDADRSGKLGYEEFVELWKSIMAWTKIFKQYDRDNSGTFSANELHLAFSTLGYKLSGTTFKAMVLRYADKDSQIKYNSFIAGATKLRHMYEIFYKHVGKDKKATFGFDDYIRATMYS